MHSVFEIGAYTIPAREFFINCGTVVGLIVLFNTIWKTIHTDKIKNIIVYSLSLLFSILGSKFAGALLEWDTQGSILDTLINSEAVNFSGYVLFFTILFPILYKLILKNYNGFSQNIKASALYMAIQHMFNRIGCLMAGCCGGREYSGFLALHYSPNDVGYYPVQPFEIISMILVLFFIIFLYDSKKVNVFCLFIMWFGITFFVGDIFRDNLYDLRILGLTISQMISCILVVTGGIMNFKFCGVNK